VAKHEELRNQVYQRMRHLSNVQINTNPSKPALSPITPEPNALPFQTIFLDFIVKLPESEGFDTILTITDHDCSKAAMFMPCNETVDAAGVAKLYATYVFPHYGLPKKVISDRDPHFASNFSREMCSLLGIKQNISMAYHPQTDGQSERTNQSLEQYLRLYCGTHQKDWAAWLPLAQYTRNSWPNASTKKTPYELILGYTPLAHQPVRDTTVPDIDTRMQLIKDAREQAQDALKQTQENMIKETKFKEFVISQKVWLECYDHGLEDLFSYYCCDPLTYCGLPHLPSLAKIIQTPSKVY